MRGVLDIIIMQLLKIIKYYNNRIKISINFNKIIQNLSKKFAKIKT